MTKKDWPTGGLERTLKEIGAKSLSQAVDKVRNKELAPVRSMVAEYLTKAMARISELTQDVDTDKIPVKRRDELAKMPLETIEEINAWGQAWAEEVKKIKV